MIDDWRITHEDFDLPEDAWNFIKQEGFFGVIIPRAYGGLEFSNAAHSAVAMKLATRSIAAAVTVMVPNSLGPGKLLLHYGTEDQKTTICRAWHGDSTSPALRSPDPTQDRTPAPFRMCRAILICRLTSEFSNRCKNRTSTTPQGSGRTSWKRNWLRRPVMRRDSVSVQRK